MIATKENVLTAALEIFPRQGYYDTKMIDICSAVGANVSAVNYYFQSKNHLYLMVWEKLWQEYAKRFQAIFEDPDMSSRDKMAKIIEMNIRDILADSGDCSLARLSFLEKSSPSPVFDEINRLYFQGVRAQFMTLMQDFFGEKGDVQTMQIASMCIREPINGLLTMKIYGMPTMNEKATEGGGDSVFNFMRVLDDVDVLTSVVIKFIFGGLEALRG